jgi:hypothetical protein
MCAGDQLLGREPPDRHCEGEARAPSEMTSSHRPCGVRYACERWRGTPRPTWSHSNPPPATLRYRTPELEHDRREETATNRAPNLAAHHRKA